MMMMESSSVCIGLRCSWNGISKGGYNENHCDQSKLEEESILLSGPYGDDVAFVQQSNEQIIIGLSDGVSGNRHHGLDPYKFAHELIKSCIEERDRIGSCSSMRGLIHRAIGLVEKRCIYGSATLCLLSIDKDCSYLRSINIGDSGFMLIRNQKLLIRSHPQYHRGSSPFQLSSFPSTHCSQPNPRRLYHDQPRDGEYLEHQLEIGDLLLIASDGLFDNLYEDLIIQIINNQIDCEYSLQSLQRVCEILVQSACHARIKDDDILVLLLNVVPCSSSARTNANESNRSCSSSACSLSSILVDPDEEDDDDQSLNLFIFED